MSDGVRATKSRDHHAMADCRSCEFYEETWLDAIPAMRARIRRHVQITGHTVVVINETTTTYRSDR